jgi:hypothetical protein
MIIATPKGSVQVLEPSVEMLRAIRDLMPFGAIQFSQPQNGARYGLVMQCDDQEVFCIKQQPVELDREGAEKWMQVQHWMIAEAYCRYIKHGFSGAYLASTYLRRRDNGLWEPGVAHFIFPSPTGMESQEFPFEHAFDNQFGHGATTMFRHFAEDFMTAFRESPITPPQYFGLDVRPRMHLQSLGMYFMVVGQQILCLRSNLREREDVAWSIFASNGVRTIYHLPALPMAIQKDDLKIAKGSAADFDG